MIASSNASKRLIKSLSDDGVTTRAQSGFITPTANAFNSFPDIRFEIVYGISGNRRAWYDNANAFRLGYRPQDDSELFAAEVLARATGAQLEGLQLHHPFLERVVPVILGDHVTLDAGTGCVHTAPGHGIGMKQIIAAAHPARRRTDDPHDALRLSTREHGSECVDDADGRCLPRVFPTSRNARRDRPEPNATIASSSERIGSG